MRNRYVLCLTAALLAGCGALPLSLSKGQGDMPPISAPGAMPDNRGSWMAPDAKKLDLLYVSDYETNDVYAYSYPQGKLRGVLRGILKGFVLPTGLCADSAGDVFVPDSSNSTVLVYAHGSTRLVRTLKDPDQLPYTCSVDRSGGDLAVVNNASFSGPGNVAIYPRARGKAKLYIYGFVFLWYFAAYDDKGDLFVDAADDVPSAPLAFLELAKGADSFSQITLDKQIRVPNGVGWDGKYVTIVDSDAAVIYRFSIAGSAGTLAGTTPLKRGRFVAQYVLRSGEAIGAAYHGANVGFWKYPAGGEPIKTIGGFGEPFGITLSEAPKPSR